MSQGYASIHVSLSASKKEMILLNTLTAVFFAGALQTLVGNAVIGLFESALANRIFKTKIKYSTGIVANYLSVTVGLILAAQLLDDTDLNIVRNFNLKTYTVPVLAYLAVAFIVSFLAELPIYSYGLKGYSMKERIKIVGFTNCISYSLTVLLWLLYLKLNE